jgi:hypothetical protein
MHERRPAVHPETDRLHAKSQDQEQTEKLRQCTNTASTPQAVAACATTALPAQQKGFDNCASTNAKMAMCFDKISPDITKARRDHRMPRGQLG